MGLTKVPTRDKAIEYMRYTLRLKPFWGLSSPEILAFETFQEAFSVGDTVAEVLLPAEMEIDNSTCNV
jgi:hypothetical protein